MNGWPRSLSGKILLAAASNASLVGLLLAVTGAIPWPFDVQAFVMSASGPAVGDVSRRVAADLTRVPAAEFDRVIAEYSNEFGVTFLLYRNDLTRVAGPASTLPAEVIDAIAAPDGRLGR